MARSARLQDLQWRFETAGYDLVAAIMRVVPIDGASAFGGALFQWLGPLTSAHRTALRNLRLAFPEWDEAERRAMARRQWENAGRVLLEFFLMDRIMADPARVELIGKERLEAIKASGRPTVFVSGHFANWEVMAATKVRAGIERRAGLSARQQSLHRANGCTPRMAGAATASTCSRRRASKVGARRWRR